AEQLVHGRLETLAEDVPQRHLDTPGRRAHDRAAVPVAPACEEVDVVADAPGIPADEPPGHVLDRALDGVLSSLDGALAVADEIAIGLDAKEDPVPPAGVDLPDRDADDPHRLRARGVVTRAAVSRRS